VKYKLDLNKVSGIRKADKNGRQKGLLNRKKRKKEINFG
jgi:hypothetical protein